jgi:predicted dehydrogenase
MKRTRIAIIGAGNHARQQHYPPLAQLPDVELCAACDLVQDKLDVVDREFSVPRCYTDCMEMIRRERPDGVVIVTPPALTRNLAVACIEAGQHVMIEKPPGCDSLEAQEILDAATAHGRKVMVSMNRRFMPAIGRLLSLAEERGGVTSCSATYNKSGFTGTRQYPAELTVVDAIHLVDLLCCVGGRVEQVHALSAKRDAEYANSCSAVMQFANGCFATLNNHQCVGGRVQRFEVHALGMSAYLDVADPAAPKCDLFLAGEPAELHCDVPDPPSGVLLDNWCETAHFARWLRGEEAARSELAAVIESVRAAEAIAAGYCGPMAEFEPTSAPGT